MLASSLIYPAAVTAAETSRSADQLWAAYAARWDSASSYKAVFKQHIEISGIGGDVSSGGIFYFEKPDKMRWDYLEGDKQQVVGDGRWIWVYQPDLEQVYKISYTQAFGSGGLVSLLAGREGIAQRYDLKLLSDDASAVSMRLTPKSGVGETLELLLDADTMDLRTVQITDPAGSVTSVEFNDVTRNVKLEAKLFSFEPPKDTDVITTPGSSK